MALTLASPVLLMVCVKAPERVQLQVQVAGRVPPVPVLAAPVALQHVTQTKVLVGPLLSTLLLHVAVLQVPVLVPAVARAFVKGRGRGMVVARVVGVRLVGMMIGVLGPVMVPLLELLILVLLLMVVRMPEMVLVLMLLLLVMMLMLMLMLMLILMLMLTLTLMLMLVLVLNVLAPVLVLSLLK
jgi:hypothetical protein